MSESNSTFDLTSAVNNMIDTNYWAHDNSRQIEITSNCLTTCPTNFDIKGVTPEEATCLKKCLVASFENSLMDKFK